MSAFTNLAGAALAEDLRRLASNPEYAGLVLFSDVAGEQLAILPVGPGQPYLCLEDVAGVEIEGLRPLCALRLRGGEPMGGAVADKERELARVEESLAVRERYIADCERRLAEVGQSLSEREAMLEQREQMLVKKEREFFRRGAEATRKAAQG